MFYIGVFLLPKFLNSFFSTGEVDIQHEYDMLLIIHNKQKTRLIDLEKEFIHAKTRAYS